MNNFIAIAVVILTWLFFFYLGHAVGKASELIKEKEYLNKIDFLLDEYTKVEMSVNHLQMDNAYLKCRCQQITDCTMCDSCTIGCEYRGKKHE